MPVFVTPNTLTETSNLLENSGDSRFLEKLRSLIEGSEEVVVESSRAAQNSEFNRLGLTDAVLLEVISPARPLFTVDFKLHRAALSKGNMAAVNFWHLESL